MEITNSASQHRISTDVEFEFLYAALKAFRQKTPQIKPHSPEQKKNLPQQERRLKEILS